VVDVARMKEAVEKAYDDAVSRNFGTLIGNIVDSTLPGSPVKDPGQAQAMFGRIMKTTNDAHARALAAVEALGAS